MPGVKAQATVVRTIGYWYLSSHGSWALLRPIFAGMAMKTCRYIPMRVENVLTKRRWCGLLAIGTCVLMGATDSSHFARMRQ